MPSISRLCGEGLGALIGEYCFLEGTRWIPGGKWLVRAGTDVREEAAAATGHDNTGQTSTGTSARPGEPTVRFKGKSAQSVTGAEGDLGAVAQ